MSKLCQGVSKPITGQSNQYHYIQKVNLHCTRSVLEQAQDLPVSLHAKYWTAHWQVRIWNVALYFCAHTKSARSGVKKKVWKYTDCFPDLLTVSKDANTMILLSDKPRCITLCVTLSFHVHNLSLYRVLQRDAMMSDTVCPTVKGANVWGSLEIILRKIQ